MRPKLIAIIIFDAVLALTAATFAVRELFVLAVILALLVLVCFLLSLPLSRWRNVAFEDKALHVYKGSYVSARIIVRNNSILPILLASIRVDFGVASMEQTVCASLLPKQQRAIVLHFSYPYRGIYSARISGMSVGDPFGLFDWRVRLADKSSDKATLAAAMFVYPVIPPASAPNPDANTSGYDSRFSRRLSSSGSMPVGSRLYQLGDSMRAIDWKTSAKRRELYTKQFEQNDASSGIVLVNNAIPLAADDELFMAAADFYCECALGAVLDALEDGVNVTVLDTSLSQEPLTVDISDCQTLAPWLTSLTFSREKAPDSAISVASAHARSIVYIGTDMSDNVREALLAQAQRGARVRVIAPLLPGQKKLAEDGLEREYAFLPEDRRREVTI
jgi:uncharacterized protein (DUF58 family)